MIGLRNLRYCGLLMPLLVSGYDDLAVAQSTHLFDGRWAVTFDPREGSCAQHEIEVRITDGILGHAGLSGFFTASGEVNAKGRVDASIGTLGIAATAHGQLADATGSGIWSFPDRGCSGAWTAHRL